MAKGDEAEGREIHRPSGLGRGVHTPVVAAVQGGANGKPSRVRTRVVADVTAANLEAVMKEFVSTDSEIHTDESNMYPRATRDFRLHRSVHHKQKEYSRNSVTTNNAEGFFSRMKRSVFGVHHKVSREHLHRYATHTESDRECIHMSVGKRLTQCLPGAFINPNEVAASRS